MELLDIRGGLSRQELYDRADAVRRERMGDAVPLRGIVEFSNICANDCLYCGIRAANANIPKRRGRPPLCCNPAKRQAGMATRPWGGWCRASRRKPVWP
jgi:biotin synthase